MIFSSSPSLKIFLLSVAVPAAAFWLFAGTPMFAQAQVVNGVLPLQGSCSGSIVPGTNDTVVWTATASQGVPPYNFVWSGDPQVNDATGATLTVTYDAVGVYAPSVRVIDAQWNTVVANCSVSIATVSTGASSSQTSAASTAAVSGVADLAVSESAPIGIAAPGSTVDFLVTLAAAGPSTSTQVAVHYAMSSGLSVAGATPSQGNFIPFSSSTGGWYPGDLPANASATLTIAAVIDPDAVPGTMLSNMVSVSEATSTGNPDPRTSADASIDVMAPASTTASSSVTESQNPADNTSSALGLDSSPVVVLATTTLSAPSTTTAISNASSSLLSSEDSSSGDPAASSDPSAVSDTTTGTTTTLDLDGELTYLFFQLQNLIQQLQMKLNGVSP